MTFDSKGVKQYTDNYCYLKEEKSDRDSKKFHQSIYIHRQFDSFNQPQQLHWFTEACNLFDHTESDMTNHPHKTITMYMSTDFIRQMN